MVVFTRFEPSSLLLENVDIATASYIAQISKQQFVDIPVPVDPEAVRAYIGWTATTNHPDQSQASEILPCFQSRISDRHNRLWILKKGVR